MQAREFLRINFQQEAELYFGNKDQKVIDWVVDAWMDDKNNSKHRFETISKYLPDANKILDMSSGCGSAVYYGLLNGYDMYGIDPEEWKLNFNSKKAKEYNYPPEWQNKFYKGIGENLPFEDDLFDCVTSYQTIEHVQNIYLCLSEMVRTVKVNGGIHITCPDYRGTFEGHYLTHLIPNVPKEMIKLYLKMIGKPLQGLECINLVTKPMLLKIFKQIQKEKPNLKIKIVDVNKEAYNSARKKSKIRKFIPYSIFKIFNYLNNLFKKELIINLFIYIEEK